MAFPVILVLAARFVHVCALRLCAVDHLRCAACRLHHDAVAVAARHRSHPVTMSGIVEGATAAVHQRVADSSAHQHMVVVPVKFLVPF